MAFFRRKRDDTPTASLQPPPMPVRWDAAEEYSWATPEEQGTMNQLMEIVLGERGDGEFEPRQIAALGELCKRLVVANPALSSFVDELRQVARTESARRPSSVSWQTLAEHL